jgi:hypothetical protein
MEPAALPSTPAEDTGEHISQRLNLKQAQKLWNKLSKSKSWSFVAKQEPGAGQERRLRIEIERLELCIQCNRPDQFTVGDRETLESYYNGWRNRKKKHTWKLKHKTTQVRITMCMFEIFSFCVSLISPWKIYYGCLFFMLGGFLFSFYRLSTCQARRTPSLLPACLYAIL